MQTDNPQSQSQVSTQPSQCGLTAKTSAVYHWATVHFAKDRDVMRCENYLRAAEQEHQDNDQAVYGARVSLPTPGELATLQRVVAERDVITRARRSIDMLDSALLRREHSREQIERIQANLETAIAARDEAWGNFQAALAAAKEG